MNGRTAADVVREARLYNDEPETPVLLTSSRDYFALLMAGAEVVSCVEEEVMVYVVLAYDGLRFAFAYARASDSIH